MKWKSLALLAICFVVDPLPAFARESSQASVENRMVAKKVDIVLLQDESGSMEKSDPHQIRKLVASSLIDDLEIAGEGNQMALVLFGARSETAVGLSRAFEAIRSASERGFANADGSAKPRSISSVNPRWYTDIYGVLKTAHDILVSDKAASASSSQDKEKHVILLTDGEMDPWPGNVHRYGSDAKGYLSCLDGRDRKTCDGRFRDEVESIDMQYLFDNAGLLGEFKEQGWQVHCIGFSPGVDSTLLQRIANATLGHAGIASDYTELLNILSSCIPPPQNVVTIYVEDFCDTKFVEANVTIDREIKAAQFKVDLNSMLGQQASVKPQDIRIILEDPTGRIRSSEKHDFRFDTTREGLVVTATYFEDRPTAGEWRITVEGVGADICGKIEVKGRVPFDPRVEFAPQMETYYGGQSVNLQATLRNEDAREDVPMRRVETKLRVSSPDGSSIEEQKVAYDLSEGGTKAAAKLVIPQGHQGIAAFETTITDEKYGSQTRHFRKVEIAPSPESCEIRANPERIDLGAVGDPAYFASGRVELTTPCPTPFELKITKPRFESPQGEEIPIVWVEVDVSSNTLAAGAPVALEVRVKLPSDVSLNLPQGVYEGEILVEIRNLQGDCVIPVQLEVKVPEVVVQPREKTLVYDFWWRLGRPIEKVFDVGHTSREERQVRIELPDSFTDSRGRHIDGISVRIPETDEAEWTLYPNDYKSVPLVVAVENPSLEEPFRIKQGRYHVEGEGLKPQEIVLQVIIPEEPFVVRYIRPASVIGGILASLLVLLGVLFFLFRLRKSLFRGTYLLNFDRAGGMARKDSKRFQVVIRRWEKEDGEYKFELPKSENPYVDVKDPDEGEWVALPEEGVPDVEDWKEEPVVIRVRDYVLKRFRGQGKGLKVEVDKTPYGSRSGYVVIKVVLPLVACGLVWAVAYWAYHIV